jgi:hypothetical protein
MALVSYIGIGWNSSEISIIVTVYLVKISTVQKTENDRLNLNFGTDQRTNWSEFILVVNPDFKKEE